MAKARGQERTVTAPGAPAIIELPPESMSETAAGKGKVGHYTIRLSRGRLTFGIVLFTVLLGGPPRMAIMEQGASGRSVSQATRRGHAHEELCPIFPSPGNNQ